jgi:hypothetical protein
MTASGSNAAVISWQELTAASWSMTRRVSVAPRRVGCTVLEVA